MAKYDISIVHSTFERLFGSEITIEKLETELAKQDWIPQIDQMIVISNQERSLQFSTEYGRFVEFKNRTYQTTAGDGRFARPLTPDEITNCF